MKDGFYRIGYKDAKVYHSIGELRTVEGVQFLFLVGFDEPRNPDEYDIHHINIPVATLAK